MSTKSLSGNQVANLLKAMESAPRDADASVAEKRSVSSVSGGWDTNDAERRATTEDDDGEPLPPIDPIGPAIRSRAVAETNGSPFTNGAPLTGTSSVTDGPPVTIYDFKRPDRIGNDPLKILWSLHESIARNFTTAVSRLLQAPLEVKLCGVDQLAYSDFVASRGKPSCISVITPAPLDGNWMLDVDPSLAFAIIDRMLGGDPVPGETPRRPLTEIENRLMSRVVTLFLEQIAPAWKNIASMHPVLQSIQSTPHRAPVATSNETVVQISFEVEWGESRDMMTLCMPYHTLESVRERLVESGRGESGDPNATDATRRQIAESIDAAKVNVVVTLARSRIQTSDLLGLSVGDIITTEQEIDHPLELAIQDIPKFHATAGAYKGKKAVQIQSTMEPHQIRHDAGEA